MMKHGRTALLLAALVASTLSAQERNPGNDSITRVPGVKDSTHIRLSSTADPSAVEVLKEEFEPQNIRVIHGKRPLRTLGLATIIATGAILPFDRQITGHARSITSTDMGAATSTLNWIGGPGSVAIPVALVSVGLATQNVAIKEMGFHSMESVLLSTAATTLIKGFAGRNRPESSKLDADDFKFKAGFRQNTATSFPSGHTTAAFALATAVTLETARSYPKAKWIVGLSSFGLASGVGMARVYSDRHWSSDVIVGAGIGTITGVLVDRAVHSKRFERNRLINWFW